MLLFGFYWQIQSGEQIEAGEIAPLSLNYVLHLCCWQTVIALDIAAFQSQ